MTAIVILVAVLALCVLAATHGTDSRFDRRGRQL
jgi:multisubunit Na+/H+ antiporter MnhC subunit